MFNKIQPGRQPIEPKSMSRPGSVLAICLLALGLVFSSVPLASAENPGSDRSEIAKNNLPEIQRNRAKLEALLPDAALKARRTLEDGRSQEVYVLRAENGNSMRQNAAELLGGKGARPDMEARVNHHIEMQVRQGRNVDATSLDVLSFEVPGVAAVYAVQDRSEELADIEIAVTDNGDGSYLFGLYAGSSDIRAESVDGDTGFNAATGSNATRKGRSTRTYYWDAAYSSDVDRWVTTSYEKWQSNQNYKQWAYNRYATFDAANGKWGWKGQIVDATIRSRPWSGHENRVTGGPFDYEPRPEEKCTTYTANLNVGDCGSLSIPYMNCYSGQEIYPNGGQHSMGTAYYGRTTSQRYLDFAFDFEVSSTSTTPIYSDYVWMEVQYCWGPGNCGLNNPSQYLKWTDSGW